MRTKRHAGGTGMALPGRPDDAALHGRPDGAETVRILLVDDDSVDRMAIERYIHEQRLDYHLVQTSSVAEARAQLAGATFDVAILDYLLRDGTGLEILAELRDTPAIILTGSGREAIAARAMRQGAYDYLIKDADRDYLVLLPATVLNALERKRAERRAGALRQLHATILSATGEGIVGVNWQGRILFANPAAENLLGYPSGALDGLEVERLLAAAGEEVEQLHVTGEEVERLLSAGDAASAWDRHPIYARCRVGERQRSDDAALRRRDGVVLPVAYTATPWRDTDGCVIGAVVVFEDITQRKRSEAALRASEQRFRALSEHANDLICILSPDGSACYESPSYRHVLGQTLAELHRAAGGPLGVIHPDDRARVRAAMAALLEGRAGTVTLECRHRHADGSWRTLEAIGTNHLDDPEIGGIVVTSRDITERKQAEEALRQSEERFHLLFSAAPAGIALADDAGRLLEVNGALCEMLGYAERELLEQGVPLLTHPDDVEESRALIRRLLAGEAQSAALEKRYLHRDGHVIWTHYIATLLRDDAGRPLYFLYHLQDITARKQAEEARARLGAIVAASDDAIFGETLDGIITAWNGGAERLYGYSAAEMVGQSVAQLIPPDQPDELAALMQAVARGETVRQYETERVRKDGTRVAIALTIAPIHDRDGAVLSASVVARDVTARKAAEKALQQSEERFRTLIEQAPVGACLMDEHGRFETVNDAFATLYGYAPGELVGRHVSAVIPPDRRAAVAAQLAARTAAGESGLREHQVVTKQGALLTVLVNTVQIVGADGRPRRASFAIDITERARMEEALHAAEERLRTLVTHAPVIFFSLDPDGFFTLSEGAGLAALGREPGAAVGHSVFDLYREHPDILEHTRRALAGEPAAYSSRVNGGVFDTHLAPLRDAHGRLLSVIGVATDITERARMEEALREAEERLRAVYGAMACGVLVLDAAGAVVEANAAGQEIIGLHVDALRRRFAANGHVAAMLREDGSEMPPEERPSYRALVTGAPVQDVVMGFRRLDGTERWVQMDAVPLLDRAGAVRHVVVSFSDITARRRAEAELRASEERFRAMLAYSPVGAAVADERGVFEFVNDTYAAFYGYTPAEMAGRPVTMLIEPERRAVLTAAYADYVARGVAVRDEYAVVTRSGERRTVLGQSVQYAGPDGRPRRATFSVDITERARLEVELRASHAEMERSNAELEQFSRVASHDLRSPLSSIGGFAQLLQLRYRGRLDAQADEYIAFITAGVARMQALIDALLSYARLDSQAKPHVPVACDALLRGALANLRAAVEEAGATVAVGELPAVRGDAAQLGQLVQNLVSNALKFRRHGVAPEIGICAERDGERWRFAVRDNGIGIDRAQAGRIFEMFGRLHTREEYEGTGIGLAVCQKIVERHGGRLWVESQPGAGSTFLFTLPAG